ncbi:MAG: superoxide dismutase family protein [Bacteroidota bacterium]
MKPVFFSSKPYIALLVVISAALFSFSSNNHNSVSLATSKIACLAGKAEMSLDTASPPMVSHAVAMLSGTYADTTVSGTVKFDAKSNGKVKMTLTISIPAKAGKSVAVHIHEHGDCGDMGKMAHGHWNPTKAQHGKWGSASFHLGDIGNVKLNAKGKGTLTLITDLWSLGGSPDKNILGKSIIVHGGVDDYTTQPTGNAGTRIGCGVIR